MTIRSLVVSLVLMSIGIIIGIQFEARAIGSGCMSSKPQFSKPGERWNAYENGVQVDCRITSGQPYRVQVRSNGYWVDASGSSVVDSVVGFVWNVFLVGLVVVGALYLISLLN